MWPNASDGDEKPADFSNQLHISIASTRTHARVQEIVSGMQAHTRATAQLRPEAHLAASVAERLLPWMQ
jgi:hypothetical protein